MQPVIFLQSAVQDPYALYASFLREHSIHWDDINRLWGIFSYQDCKEVLHHPAAHIPAIDKCGLNEHALIISDHLTRISNGEAHHTNSAVTMHLYQSMRHVAVEEILPGLLQGNDWVDSVCKRLPVLLLLKSFSLSAKVLPYVAPLTKLMLPVRTAAELLAVNESSTAICRIIQDHFPDFTPAHISNLTGLLIQSYDAGRGTLCNTMLHYLQRGDLCSVTETLRFDPPIHHTRRVAAEDMLIGKQQIRKGDVMLLVLAAANRDEQQFAAPDVYDSTRGNNDFLLTFGTGAHACIARHFSINMATDTLAYMKRHYKDISLLSQEIIYESLTNARLLKQLLISYV